jgi:hypothetical protein
VEREDGSRQAAGYGEERRVEAVTVDHVASARRTRCHASGEWRWGYRKADGGAQARCSTHAALRPRRCGCCNAVAVEHAMVMRAQRMGSRMDTGTMAIQEEDENGFFYFCADSSVACWAVRAGVEAHPCASRLNGRPTDIIHKRVTMGLVLVKLS